MLTSLGMVASALGPAWSRTVTALSRTIRRRMRWNEINQLMGTIPMELTRDEMHIVVQYHGPVIARASKR